MKELRCRMSLIFVLMVNISWAQESEEMWISTLINETTLFSHCTWRDPCEEVYKAILRLPDLNDYTDLSHFNAFYLESEAPETPVDQLIVQLIAEAKNSNEYLTVHYLVEKQDFFQIEYGGGKFSSRAFCANVLEETVTIKFNNGLTLSSVERAYHEVPMERCEIPSR